MSARGSGDFGGQFEKGALPIGVQTPVHGRGLVAIGVIVFARIEEAPRRVFSHGTDAVVPRFVEIEMVILIEKNRLRRIAGHLPRLADHLGDSIRIRHAIPVQEKEVRAADDIFFWDRSTAVGSAD